MKKLQFTYEMTLRFDEPVRDHYFALRCVPMSNAAQQIQIENRYVYPTDCLNEVVDGFGNHKYVGHYFDNHKQFTYEISGTAVVEGMRVIQEPLHSMYKFPSRLTRPGTELKAFLEKLQSEENFSSKSNLEKAITIMNAVYDVMEYKADVTDIHTTAEEALEGKIGVCQDYAHICIASCRLAGIPARYVNGLMIGEGATHAWLEIYTGKGWYGLDPTNNLHVDDYYIKLAHGRDYGDCVLDKGRFLGSVNQTQQIKVCVEEI
ncbi:transglutaminase domain-containing protein [Hespellia stercorisuis]|uniref:Transglutaminase-like enzyme, putative cysteine protease n=1 Tax=Hespellia stercorisuis DSM 15480 TaxID=1121950 RepID=A0A1M6NPP3_9FIRM|nr:transglutaminase family protein [Hespellia stercorisuis]SHJ97640.1 Transglutaminase-like enzyme, putative cysteine protease [Hespellia stercorisuis DSM 15480]